MRQKGKHPSPSSLLYKWYFNVLLFLSYYSYFKLSSETFPHSMPPIQEFGTVFPFLYVSVTWYQNSLLVTKDAFVVETLSPITTDAISALSGVNLAGILGGLGVDPKSLVRAKGEVRWAGTPAHWGRGQRGGGVPPPQKKEEEFFTWNGVFRWTLSSTFCPRPCQKKMLNFPPEVVICWTIMMHFYKIVNILLE